MTGNEYQKKAMRTNDKRASKRFSKVIHDTLNETHDIHRHTDIFCLTEGVMGLAGEVGEFTELIKKWLFHSKTIDLNHAKKELGDVLWYVAMVADTMGWSLEEIMQTNIKKLENRYPIKFDTQLANNKKSDDI